MRLGFQSVNLTAQFYGTAIYSTGTSPWEHALANCASVCQVNQGARDSDGATEAEADGAAVDPKEVK
jgi:hypothetical protein